MDDAILEQAGVDDELLKTVGKIFFEMRMKTGYLYFYGDEGSGLSHEEWQEEWNRMLRESGMTPSIRDRIENVVHEALIIANS